MATSREAALHPPPPAPVDADLAEYHEIAEPGPTPIVRAVTGIAVGMAAGALAAALTPRTARPMGPRWTRRSTAR